MPTFKFDKYTLRPAEGEADLALAAAWMEADRWHRGQFKPEFWLEQSATVNSFVLEDEAGPIFFFKTRLPELRAPVGPKGVDLYIQFEPMDVLAGAPVRWRTMVALEKGFAWLKKKLGGVGYDSVYFESKNPKLIEFCERRLGFVVDAATERGTRLKAYMEAGGSDGEAESQNAQQSAG